MLQEPELKGVPLLVLANKQDLRGAVSPDKVADSLGLYEKVVHDWTGDGWNSFIMGVVSPGCALKKLHGNQQLLQYIWG